MASAKTAPIRVPKPSSQPGVSSIPISSEERSKIATRFSIAPDDISIPHRTAEGIGLTVKRDPFKSVIRAQLGEDTPLDTSEQWLQAAKKLREVQTELSPEELAPKPLLPKSDSASPIPPPPSSSLKNLEAKVLSPQLAERLTASGSAEESTHTTGAGRASPLPSSSVPLTPLREGKPEASKSKDTVIDHGSVTANRAAADMEKRIKANPHGLNVRKDYDLYLKKIFLSSPLESFKRIWNYRRPPVEEVIVEPEVPDSTELAEEGVEEPLFIEPELVETLPETTEDTSPVDVVSRQTSQSSPSAIGTTGPRVGEGGSQGSVQKQSRFQKIIGRGGARKPAEKKLSVKGAIPGKKGQGRLAGTKDKVQKVKNTAKAFINGARAFLGDPVAMKNLALMALKSATVRRIGKYIAGGGTAVGIYLLTHLLGMGLGAVVGAVVGGIIGGVLGSVVGPAGTVVGAVGGAAAGAYVGVQLANSLGGLGGAATSLISGLGGAVSTVATGITALWGGAVASVLPALGVTALATTMFLGWLFAQQRQDAFQSYAAGTETTHLITVRKTVDKPMLDNNPPAGTSVVYTVEIATTSDKEVTIVVDDKTVNVSGGTSFTLPMPAPSAATPYPTTVTKDKPVKVIYQPLAVVGEQFNDSTIINTVTVTASTSDGETEIRTAEALVRIGQINDKPYGFPAGGTVTSLDRDPCGDHQGVFYRIVSGIEGAAVDGGIDIAAGANAAVLSTLDGRIISTGWDLPTAWYENGLIQSRKNPLPVGGYIYIQSLAGNYIAGYLHLNMPDHEKLRPGTIVKRGETIGSIYPSAMYPTTTGPHVHYQVIYSANGIDGWQNVAFDDSAHAGVCSQNPLYIETSVPLAPTEVSCATGNRRITYNGSVAAGPFSCQ